MLTKIKKTFLIAIVVLANVVAGISAPAMADGPTSTCPTTLSFFPAWYDGLLQGNCKDIKSPTDMGGADSGANIGTWLTIIVMNIVRMLLYAVGYASLIFIIYGGFKYMTQGDSSSGTVSARKTIQNAVIGLVLSVMSVSIVTFVVQQVSSAGGGNCTTSAATGGSGSTPVQINSTDLGLPGAPGCADSATVGKLFGIAYLIAGIVAVIVIIIGGIRYATANGDSGQIQSAKNMILYAVVGLVIIIMANAITNFVLTQITK